MSFPGPYAVSLATAIRVGNLIGAKKAEGARKAAKAGQNIALSIVLCSSGSLVLFHNRIGACITGDARILQMIAQYVSDLLFDGKGLWRGQSYSR